MTMAKKTYVAAAGLAACFAPGVLAQSASETNPAGTGALDWLAAHFGLIAIIAIVLAFLAVGIPDLLRLSFYRLWALSSVSFRESVRRRVLWVTPLAMLGIIAVTQLSHPVDEQDAIRQATKYALFATGLVVVVATLILACTNLPKEIDNRVIYTIVTKPATRLEIVLGKTLGFARTSALILLVMGLFTYAYLHLDAAQLQSGIRQRLKTMPASDLSRDTLQHYADQGLLQAREYARPVDLAVVAEPPVPGDKYVWQVGAAEQNANFGFSLPADALDNPDAQLLVNVEVAFRQPRPLTRHELEDIAPDLTATTQPGPKGDVIHLPGKPRITVQILDPNGFSAVTPQDLLDLRHRQDNKPDQFRNGSGLLLDDIQPAPGAPAGRAGVGYATVAATSKSVNERIKLQPIGPDGKRHIAVMVVGETPGTLFGFARGAVKLQVVTPTPTGTPDVRGIPPDNDANGQPGRIVFRGRLDSSHAQQLRGDEDVAEAPVAIYSFKATHLVPAGDQVPFEFRSKIERSDEADKTGAENATRVTFTFKNRKTGNTAGPIMITPDADRPTYFRAPRAAVEGGEFDVLVQSRTTGHYLSLRGNSVSVVARTSSFAANLAKSLFILWLLSVLVVIISIFCSTFVSWPIAVVLTLVLLLGRWCVVQLGDPTSPQQMATDFFGANSGVVQTRVFTDTVGALNKLLTFTAKVLPDLDQFRVTEDIERGVTIPFKTLVDPLGVLLTFGVPILILAYVFLRRKEVAP
jgi:hypothetical protein